VPHFPYHRALQEPAQCPHVGRCDQHVIETFHEVSDNQAHQELDAGHRPWLLLVMGNHITVTSLKRAPLRCSAVWIFHAALRTHAEQCPLSALRRAPHMHKQTCSARQKPSSLRHVFTTVRVQTHSRRGHMSKSAHAAVLNLLRPGSPYLCPTFSAGYIYFATLDCDVQTCHEPATRTRGRIRILMLDRPHRRLPLEQQRVGASADMYA
jgi:hypothetical protein